MPTECAVATAAFPEAYRPAASQRGNCRRFGGNGRPGIAAPGGVGIAEQRPGASNAPEAQQGLQQGAPGTAPGKREGNRVESSIVHRAATPFRKDTIDSERIIALANQKWNGLAMPAGASP